MVLNIYLVDVNKQLCEEWRKYKLPENIKILNESIKTFSSSLHGTNVFVCSSNVLGITEKKYDGTYGGINKIYTDMFPTLMGDAMKGIDKYGKSIDYYGFKIIPVGSALLVPISGYSTISELNRCNNYIIFSSSMILSESNINNTDNSYHCYKSIFDLIKKINFKIDNLIISGIGTGVGGVPPPKCANAFYRAITDKTSSDESPKMNNIVLNNKLTDKQLKDLGVNSFKVGWDNVLWVERKRTEG